jgi:hypothetical protein
MKEGESNRVCFCRMQGSLLPALMLKGSPGTSAVRSRSPFPRARPQRRAFSRFSPRPHPNPHHRTTPCFGAASPARRVLIFRGMFGPFRARGAILSIPQRRSAAQRGAGTQIKRRRRAWTGARARARARRTVLAFVTTRRTDAGRRGSGSAARAPGRRAQRGAGAGACSSKVYGPCHSGWGRSKHCCSGWRALSC